MDRNQTARLICFAIAAIIGVHIFMALLPYLVKFLAFCGAYYLWQEYEKNKKGRY